MLRLARKNKPPQSWYDETVNPFESKKAGACPWRPQGQLGGLLFVAPLLGQPQDLRQELAWHVALDRQHFIDRQLDWPGHHGRASGVEAGADPSGVSVQGQEDVPLGRRVAEGCDYCCAGGELSQECLEET
jgi:hypothetical protein